MTGSWTPQERDTLRQDLAKALGALPPDVPIARLIPTPDHLTRKRPWWSPGKRVLVLLAGLVLVSAGWVAARGMAPITFSHNHLSIPSRGKRVPLQFRPRISERRAIAVAQAYLRLHHGSGTILGAHLVTRQTVEFRSQTASKGLPAEFWMVNLRSMTVVLPTLKTYPYGALLINTQRPQVVQIMGSTHPLSVEHKKG